MAPRSPNPFDPEVVRPWTLGGGRRGALLFHGFAGTPPELRRLGEHLAANGWRCSAPAMAGHATTPEDHRRHGWRDWAASARAALDQLAAESDHVVVAGQSMGGTMALYLAALDPRVKAVAALAAPIWIRDWRLRFLPLLTRVHPWHSSDPDDIDLYLREAAEELYSYGRRSTRSIVELSRFMRHMQRDLVTVRAPVLLLHGARDRTVDPANMSDIARRLVCSAAVETHLYVRSGHALSVDIDREDVNARVLAWFDRYVPPPEPAPGSGDATPGRAAHGAAAPPPRR
jgi:carboxylesterase